MRSSRTRRAIRVIGTVTVLVCLAVTARAWDSPPIGRPVEAFTLPDFHGKPYALSDYQDRVVVLAFLGTECPLVRHYAPGLSELAAECDKQGVALLGVFSNLQDSLTDIAAFGREHQLTFPLLKDNNNQLADQLRAERTPEVFVLDRQHVVRYRGRIDDQYGLKNSGGYAKPKPTEHYLADALEEILASKPVSRPEVNAVGCLIGRVTKVAPHGDVTYCKHIAKIIQDRCLECHRPGQSGPFAMSSYEELVGWAATIREVVAEGRMPPWFASPKFGHFRNDPRLSDEEKAQLFAWIDNGCPQGDARDLPEQRQFVEGWQIGQPDQIIYMRDEPFEVPAEGTLDNPRFTVDPGWTTGKWIAASEVRPGVRAVVHHIRVDVKADHLSEAFVRDIGTYVPGDMPNVWPAGSALYVPANSKLMFELHYTPNGTAQKDRSMLGVKFADPRTVERLVHGRVVDNITFKIPPGAPNYEVNSQYRFAVDTQLLYLWPHMHLRGKDFSYEAYYPDGTIEILLDVPRYDFNWQLRYIFDKPKLMPKGTWLKCTAHYDNSADNLSNPDPTQTVVPSELTSGEMMQGTCFSLFREQDTACIALKSLTLAAEARASATAQPATRPAK